MKKTTEHIIFYNQLHRLIHDKINRPGVSCLSKSLLIHVIRVQARIFKVSIILLFLYP